MSGDTNIYCNSASGNYDAEWRYTDIDVFHLNCCILKANEYSRCLTSQAVTVPMFDQIFLVYLHDNVIIIFV